LLIVISAVVLNPAFAQYERGNNGAEHINWTGIETVKISEFESRKFLTFEKSITASNLMPILKKQFDLRFSSSFEIDFSVVKTTEVTADELEIAKSLDLESDFTIKKHVSTSKKLN